MWTLRSYARYGVWVAVSVTWVTERVSAQRLAWDEFDGVGRGGWKEEGIGEWRGAGATEQDGVLMTVHGNHWRALEKPIDGGVVWYVVALRMQEAIDGYASVTPAVSTSTQFSELGFNRGFGHGEGMWTSSAGLVRTGIEAAELQTFVQRYDLDRGLWSAWAVRGMGGGLLDENGTITRPPSVDGAALKEKSLGWIYLTKGSVQVLVIERLALARTAREALTPSPADSIGSTAGSKAEEKMPAPSVAPNPPALVSGGIAALVGPDTPLKSGDRMSFFGDSITWQGGFIERLREAFDRRQPPLAVELLKRGINGGRSSDLRDGCTELYGCTQAPFAEVVRQDGSTVVVILIGINDVWHGREEDTPETYRAALTTMVEAAKERGAAVVVATPPLIGEQRRGENSFDTQLDEYAKVALDVARQKNAIACDLRSACFAALASRNPDDSGHGILTYDGVHLSESGNALFADAIAGSIEHALREPRTAKIAPEDLMIDLPLVPWPRKVSRREGDRVITAESIQTKAPELREVADVLRKALAGLASSSGVGAEDSKATILLAIDRTLAAEEYRVNIADSSLVSGGSAKAVAWGCATVLQLARVVDGRLTVPKVKIADRPDCEYRGLLVDVARQWHPLETLLPLVDLCWLYRISHLQLHLTDDQSFTFPSKSFPRLATKGRSYTEQELAGLEAYSRARGVTLVPELDMPGHCGAMIGAMPELFRASEKHHATINFASPRVVAAMETLVDEMLAIFASSPWFHIGGDEADLAHVHENQDFQKAMKREKVGDVHELYCRFLQHMNDFVKKRGRRTLVWEGFSHASRDLIPTDVTVMAYEAAYHLPDCLLRDGYVLINTSWEPLYVVNERCWPPQEIHAWDRFYWKHFLEGFPAFKGLRVEPTPQVIGAQMCAWEQPADLELSSLRLRLPAMSERLWNPDSGKDYQDFAARLAITDRRLDQLLVPSPPH